MRGDDNTGLSMLRRGLVRDPNVLETAPDVRAPDRRGPHRGCGRGGAAREGAPGPSATPAAARSVLLITIDTLRADRLGCYGDTRARTPRIDALAAPRDGLRARVHARAHHAARPRVAVHRPASARPRRSRQRRLCPRRRRADPRRELRRLRPPHRGLRRRLSARAALRARPRVRPLRRPDGQGHRRPLRVRGEARGRRGRRRRSAWLAAHPGDVFVWVHLFDPHAPYDPPPPFTGDDPYRGEIAAVDAAVGRLLDAWDARPGPAVVALTADHGEAFGEHGEESHSLFVYDVTLRVPLVLTGAGVPRGAAGATPVSIVDLGATLADARRSGAATSGQEPLRRRGRDAPAVRRDARAPLRFRLERPAVHPRRAPQVHPRPAPRAVRRRGRPRRDAEPRRRAARGRGAAVRGARRGPGRRGRGAERVAPSIRRPRSGCAPSVTCRASPRAGRARIPRTRWRWRCGSRAPPALSATTPRPPPPTARSPPSIPTFPW